MAKRKTLKDLTPIEREELGKKLSESTNKFKNSMETISGKLSGEVPKGILEIFENKRKLEELKESSLAFKISKLVKQQSTSNNGLGSGTENTVSVNGEILKTLKEIKEMNKNTDDKSVVINNNGQIGNLNTGNQSDFKIEEMNLSNNPNPNPIPPISIIESASKVIEIIGIILAIPSSVVFIVGLIAKMKGIN